MSPTVLRAQIWDPCSVRCVVRNTFAEDVVGEGNSALMKFDETDFLPARPYIAMLITFSESSKIVSRRNVP
jgi:hypothetical protein